MLSPSFKGGESWFWRVSASFLKTEETLFSHQLVCHEKGTYPCLEGCPGIPLRTPIWETLDYRNNYWRDLTHCNSIITIKKKYSCLRICLHLNKSQWSHQKAKLLYPHHWRYAKKLAWKESVHRSWFCIRGMGTDISLYAFTSPWGKILLL